MALISLDDYKTATRTTKSEDNDLIESLISRAQSIIESQTFRFFDVSTNTTRYFHAVDDVVGAKLWLDADLCSINTVTNGDGTVITAGQYVPVKRNMTPYYAIKLLGSSGVVWNYVDDPEDAIAISGKWGYSTTPPEGVAHLCIRLTDWLYKRSLVNSEADKATISPTGAVLLPAGLPRDMLEIMSAWRRPGL